MDSSSAKEPSPLSSKDRKKKAQKAGVLASGGAGGASGDPNDLSGGSRSAAAGSGAAGAVKGGKAPHTKAQHTVSTTKRAKPGHESAVEAAIMVALQIVGKSSSADELLTLLTGDDF